MKYKTMNKVINKKFDDWVRSIEDQDVRRLVNKNTIITGGCITSMFLKEKINDFDVYFTNIETTYAVAKYYADEMSDKYRRKIQPQIVKLENEEWEPQAISEEVLSYVPDIENDVKYRVRCFIKSAGVAESSEYEGAIGDEEQQYDPETEQEPISPSLDEIEEQEETTQRKKYQPVYITSNAITLTDKIQIVLRFYGEADVIHANYDFVHVTNYWTSEYRKIVDNILAYRSMGAKELVYTGSRYPLASIIRMKKFIGRGWTCNAGQIVKMVYQLNDLDLNNPRILEEQLTGVDVAYFHGLISEVKKKHKDAKESGEDFDVKSYFLKVVEKIFD